MTLMRINIDAEADLDDFAGKAALSRSIDAALDRIGVEAIDIIVERAD